MTSTKPSLKAVLVHGSSWTLSLQIIKFVAQVATMSIMARLLAPRDFGIIAMLASSFALLDLVRDLGMNVTLVQRAEISNSHFVKIFKISYILGIAMFGTGSVLGYFIAWFTNESAIKQIAPIMALVFITNSLATVPMAILRRNLMFKQLALRDFFSYLLGTLVGVLVAALGYGYWALVAASLVSSTTNVIMVWASARWWPRGSSASFSEVKQMLRLGGALTLGEFANYVNSNADNILIGKFWGMAGLGLYTRGYALMLAPLGQIIGPLGAVIQPVMCRLNDNENQLMHMLSRMSVLFGGLSIFLASFVLIASPSVIPLVLGPGWEVTIKVVQWLSMSVFVRPLAALLYWSVVAKGQSGIFLKWAGTNCGINLLAILIGLPHGPVGVAIALGIASVIAILPNAIFLASAATHHTRSNWFGVYIKSLLVFGTTALLAKLTGLFENVGSNVCESISHTALATLASTVAAFIFVNSHQECRAMIRSILKEKLRLV